MPDPLYVRARRALLDAVEALAEHRDALVVGRDRQLGILLTDDRRGAGRWLILE